MKAGGARLAFTDRLRQSGRSSLGVFVLYGALSVLFCAPFFNRPSGVGILDRDEHLFYYVQVLKNAVEYAQLPFWSPWYCGGSVLWQNPQVALLSPAYPLAAIMPLALAMNVNIVLHYWVGFIGMHLLLTRVIGLTFLPLTVYLAAVFTLAGASTLHLAVGQSVFLAAFYLPLQLFFFFRGLKSGALRDALWSGALVALMIYAGGLQIVPMALLAIGALSVCLAVARRSWRPVVLAAVIAVSGAAYAAPKLVPVSSFVSSDLVPDTRNPTTHPDRMTSGMILRTYTDASQRIDSTFSEWQRHGWWEYGNYVGIPASLLILANILFVLAYRSGPDRDLAVALALTSLLFLVLSAGEFNGFAPASLLGRVPFFSSFHIPSRYTIAFALFGALTAGAAATSLREKMFLTRARQTGVAVVGTLALLQLAWVNSAHFRVLSVAPLASGSGTLTRDCDPSTQLTRGPALAGPFVWSDGKSTISAIVFTPNRVQFSAIGGAEPSKVFLDQYYAPGWRSTAGPVLRDPAAGGRMYVELAPGQTGRFSFSFVPPGLIAGLGLFVLGAALSALAWHRHLPADSFHLHVAEPWARPAVSFSTRAEQISKLTVMSSVVLAIAVTIMFTGSIHADLTLMAVICFGAALLLSLVWAESIAGVLVFIYLAPALVAHVWVNNAWAYTTLWMSALLGAAWGRSMSRRWMLPAPWRVPLAGWALAVAVTWPIVVARELDFTLQRSAAQPISAMGVPASTAVSTVALTAATVMLGVLWLDWLFAAFSDDERGFRRVVVAPLLVSAVLACAVGFYQVSRDITFLNEDWVRFGRAGATMIDANAFGIVAMLCSCGFVTLMDRRRVAWTVAMLIGIALTSVGVWASGSRTALMAGLVACAFMLWSAVEQAGQGATARVRRRRIIGVAMAAVVALFFLFAGRGTGPARRLEQILPRASVQSVTEFAREMWTRGGYGSVAVEMIRQNPWFGVGIGAYSMLLGDYPYSHLKAQLVPDNAQNWVRHQLAELGLVGSIGWMTWAVVLATTIFRRKAAAAANRRAVTIGGALVAVVVVSQVGMPTQNLPVAITCWTFLFWYISLTSPAARLEASTSTVASWHWKLLAILLLLFAGGTLHAALTTLQVPMRARSAGWNYSYGFSPPERAESGEEFRWTAQEAVAVVAAPKRVVKVTVWFARRDIAVNPVRARVWHERKLVIDAVFHDHRPLTTYVVIDESPQWLMIRTKVDGIVLPSDSEDPFAREHGLAMQWTFLDAMPAIAPSTH